MAIYREEADRSLSLYDFIGKLSHELTIEEYHLANRTFFFFLTSTVSFGRYVNSKIRFRKWCTLEKIQVSTLIDNWRSKIINLLNEFSDNVQYSKLTVKHKIMDYAVEFEKESIGDFKNVTWMMNCETYHLNQLNDLKWDSNT